MNSVVHEVFLALLSGFIAACFLGPMTYAVLGGMLKQLFRGPRDPVQPPVATSKASLSAFNPIPEGALNMVAINDLPREEGLSSSDRGAVVGGMSCEAATAVSSVYILTGNVLHALGDEAGSSLYLGYGYGMRAGACN
jgi:hypothetical protein